MTDDTPMLEAVTANDLLSGDVVYLTADHGWTRDLAAAAIAGSNAEAEDLLAHAERQETQVVGPYRIAVAHNAQGVPVPLHYRERIRTLGPSNRPDLGRQAEIPAVRRQEPPHVPL